MQLKGYGQAAEMSGRWQGHTRVSLLSAEELGPHDPRYHSWIKKVRSLWAVSRVRGYFVSTRVMEKLTTVAQDLFRNTAPVIGGVGMKLMQKMG